MTLFFLLVETVLEIVSQKGDKLFVINRRDPFLFLFDTHMGWQLCILIE